jgi:NitT/TauT family transport system permease protein
MAFLFIYTYMKELFKLGGKLPVRLSAIIGVSGFILIVGIWQLITGMGWVPRAILPSPLSVITCFRELHFQDFLVRNAYYSIKLNFLGYLEAIIMSLLLGFIIGLFPFFRSLLAKYIDAIRFVPLAAVTGIFIAWFGIYTNMKVQFLSFGIMVFLLPIVVQRIDEVAETYLQTAYTLGATSWQTIWSVYWPHVTSKLIDDIRVLTAISWTYIIVAEMVNKDKGLGAMIHISQRQSRLDKVFALLIIIIIIGILQDKLFVYIDRKLFPYKKSK